ncbi:permease [Fundidesulfovibrio terrae]|uniref:permease n=1 Tax=Fundidesulfovibrio terrae TaxID=2922866 RepID=UPI001FAF7625|nr:permease [Fundidesulfovibrio terrae]
MKEFTQLTIFEDQAQSTCSCDGISAATGAAVAQAERAALKRYTLLGAPALLLWFGLYSVLEPTAQAITYDVLGLDHGGRFADALAFFLYDGPKVLLLLTLVVFGVGIIRSFFTAARARKCLAGRREVVGNVLAALLGIVTPFCSCSAVPLFVGFVTAGVPLGVTFSFLVSAPMVNEVALVLLYGLMGWKVAGLYLATGLLVAMVSGWVIGRLKMEGHLEEWVRLIHAGQDLPDQELSWAGRIQAGVTAVKDIVGKTWPWVLAGIAVGAGIHGYVPEGFMASIMGRDAWWSVLAAVGIGIPMYSNAAGIIPVVHALLEKGAALGTVLAFMMSVIALSLPEMIILRKVLKPRLLLTFVGVVGLGILLVGYLFNLIL